MQARERLGRASRNRGSFLFGAGSVSGGFQPPDWSFDLPLMDAGAGKVQLTPTYAAGSPTPTFTRATAKWTKLSTGLWMEVASGVAASCYLGADTAVGAYGGYFAEGAGTQLVTPTASIRDMTDASWVKGATMTAALTGTGIDGVANSCSRLTGGAVSATNTAFQTLTAAASSRTYSVWLKRVTGTGTINITQDGGVGYTDVTSQINSTTFTRVSLTASQLNAVFGIQVVTSTDVILADFNQFEAGASATSPMAAAGAARNKDVLSYVLAGNISGVSGSFYAEVSSAVNSGVQGVGSSNTGGRMFYTSSGQSIMFDGANATATPAITWTTSVQKVASSWGTSLKCFVGGTAGTSATFDGNMGFTGVLEVGDVAEVGPLFGCIRNYRIYSRALTDAQLQAMTT